MLPADAFGATVTDNGDGTWTRGGMTVSAATQAEAAGTFDGMAPDGWTPPASPPPTTIPALAFIQRFTPAEQTAITAANPLWPIMIAAAGTIDVTAPTLLANIAAAVTDGLLTQARATFHPHDPQRPDRPRDRAAEADPTDERTASMGCFECEAEYRRKANHRIRAS